MRANSHNDNFPVQKASQLSALDPRHSWLIEELWGAEDVGIIGAQPKSCKSYLALQMAVAVASGNACLDRFPVARKGRVLLYAAEDATQLVRKRLDGICFHANVTLDELDLWAITAPIVRLDLKQHRKRLFRTVEELAPVLLILDPFVRMHRIDENVSGAVAPLLAFLRELQRAHGCAVALVHHFKKGSSNGRAGQALRGSSEFHAWFDTGLFLCKKGEHLLLSAEHRAHPSFEPIRLRLYAASDATALVPVDGHMEENTDRPETRVLEALRSFKRPVRTRYLRAQLRMRTATLCSILSALSKAGAVLKTDQGWVAP